MRTRGDAMRRATVASLVCICIALAMGAGAHTDHRPEAQTDRRFVLIKQGTDAIQPCVSRSLAGDFAVLLSLEEFQKFRKDADLGPFIAFALRHKQDAIV